MDKFLCPICGYSDRIRMDWAFMKGELIECPKCLEVLRVKNDYSLENFRDVLIDNKSKRKAESKLNEPDYVSVKSIGRL